MKKTVKAMLAIVVAFSVVLSLTLFLGNHFDVFDDSSYVRDLTDIYRQYDGDLSAVDMDDEFALKRIVVNGYNGKRYGCVARAWDKKHDFAVLQYASREAAMAAKARMNADGMMAEGDCKAELDVAAGDFNPSASAELGTPTYIGKIGMETDDVVVAVIDSGVMYDHVYLQNRFYSHGVDYSSDACEDAYYDTNETEGSKYFHSTAVCGVIANNTPDNVLIQPYKVMAFGDTSCTASAIVSAINAAVDLNVDCINMSLYTKNSGNVISYAVSKALKKNICICASAGNGIMNSDGTYQGVLIEDRYPTCCPGVIVVAAANGESIASFSNYGEEVDFTAQGTSVRTTYPYQGQSMANTLSGTSFSTPFITACCADLKLVKNNLTRDQVYDLLKDFVKDLGDEGRDDSFGWGIPDIGHMVYTDEESYSYAIPEGTLDIYDTVDYTAATQPWKLFADRLVQVNVDNAVNAIGDYAFYHMPRAVFNMKQEYPVIGSYAFCGCSRLSEYTMGMNAVSIGRGAFSQIDSFTLRCYRNTPAEIYAINEEVNYDIIGCNHNYIYETFEPSSTQEGYTLYTCTVCGDSYRGAYIPPVTVTSGICGEDLTYTLYESGKMIIDGTGDMYDYYNVLPPWYDYREQITILQLNQYVEELSPFAFYGCHTISKIRLDESNHYYVTDDALQSLIRADDGKLVLLCARGEYSLPELVQQLDATAFMTADALLLSGNSCFTVKDKMIRDTDDNIVAVLPNYSADTLSIDKNITVKKNAFILTEHPDVVDTNRLGVQFEEHSIGYYYNESGMTKRDVTFRICADSNSYPYAYENGFTIESDSIMKCGDDMTWRYDAASNKIIFSGSGDMDTYQSVNEVPWRTYLSTLQTVVIGEEIHALSNYAFYNAAALKTLTLPISVKAFENNTIWYGCSNIKTIRFTYGTGYSDDYVTQSGTLLYKLTPWYLSKENITSYSINNDVKYIGREMFRNAKFLKELTFNEIEEIADKAFLACTQLTKVTNYSKNTVYGQYSVFGHMLGGGGYYPNCTLYAYNDSTSYDYVMNSNGVLNFASLGCGHSRGCTYVSGEQESCCFIRNYYTCDDCGETLEYLEHSGEGHHISFSLQTTRDEAVAAAEIYAQDTLLGVTNAEGELMANLYCGSYPISVCVHGTVLYQSEMTVDGADMYADVTLRYGDFVADGVINGKDYAYALRHGFGEEVQPLLNYGRYDYDENTMTVGVDDEN